MALGDIWDASIETEREAEINWSRLQGYNSEKLTQDGLHIVRVINQGEQLSNTTEQLLKNYAGKASFYLVDLQQTSDAVREVLSKKKIPMDKSTLSLISTWRLIRTFEWDMDDRKTQFALNTALSVNT